MPVSVTMAPRSIIPHLARAILEKRSSQPCRVACVRTFASAVRSVPPPPARPLPRSSSVPSQPAPKRRKDWPAQMTSIQDSREARRVSVYFKATGAFAFFISLYSFYLYFNWKSSVISHANSDDHLPFNADVSSRWKELGRDFDDEVNMSEKLMLMKNKRRKLVQRAYGNVLEVSVGTGRNLDYYNLRGFDPTKPKRRNLITQLTLNDQSAVIMAAAEKKLETIVSRQEKPPAAKVDFVVGDAGISGVIQRPEGGYDTIVQTMGVCSMVDPVGFLKRMGKLCRQPGEVSRAPEKYRAKDDDGKGGQILLLEHGRGYFDWLNWVLDTGASLHAHKFGCWWNKDIEKVVEQSGLEVEQIKRYHGGTTWMIVLRPKAQQDTQQDSRLENMRPMSRAQGQVKSFGST